ncbi:prothage tail length tape measure [Pseudomonas chlororaphis]|uniref:Prothage tail length tape measure n=1 Tax=Pseudomonas chlororaphis TaxID=587753 RepID=A0AB34C6N5_9PSED|nr:phage tail length tape measure family protein [Pseudomonas chlororaphis]KAA5841987.1 prothage tail length tape measure [Pseudomonas chlororaphis]
MTQTSRLVLEIDSRDAEQKAADTRKALEALEGAGLRVKPAMDKAGSGLDGLSSSSEKAEKSAGRTGRAWSEATSGISKDTQQIVRELQSLNAKQDATAKLIESVGVSLNKASGAFTDAAASVGKLRAQNDSASTSIQKVGESFEQAKARIIATAKESLKASEYVNSMAASSEKAGASFDVAGNKASNLAATVARLKNESDGNVAANGRQADSSRKAAAASESQTVALANLLGSIDPVTRKLGELDKQEKELAKNRKLGLLDADTFADYQSKINNARADLGRFNTDLNKTGMTAKATAAALRGVPAQFTDIAVSLQGGQAPLTVFLQQGGQLKDMFGGVGPAAKALGGYIVGLINPFTVLAASLGALAAVYYDAEKEASAFNKALFSGSASSGQTAGTLSAIAKNASEITGRLGEAKSAVIALAASSGLSQVQFRNLAEAATAIGEFTGKSAGEVAKSLGDMGNNATKAAEKISAQYGLLTSAQYEVIKGLDDQGKKQQALDLLSETLNQSAQARFKRYRDSLSDIERDWNDIGTAISNAYSKVRGELFPDSAKQIEIIERILKTRKDGGLAGAVSTGLSKLNGALGLDDGNNDDSTAALEKRLALLKQNAEVAKSTAELDGKTTRENQARIEADVKWSALAKKELSDQAKLVKDITDARRLGVEAGKSQADIDKVVADIQAKYDKAQPKTPKAKAYTEDAGMKALDAARQTQAVLLQQNASLNAQGIATEKVGAQAQALIKWEQQLADIKGKKTLTADQKSLLASQDLITAQLKKNVALEREAEISKGIQQAQKDQVQLLTLTGQLREANSLKSSLDDAAQMAEYERQGNVEAAKRLETLIKIREINLKAVQKPGTVEGVTKAPETPGLDASVGGPYSEIDRLNEASEKLDEWRATELEKQQAYFDLKAINEQTYADRVANINQQAQDNRLKIEQAKNQALLVGASDFFGNMSALSQSENKKLAAIGKAAAITQATIDGYLAVQKALAAFPPPFNFAAAAAVGVATAANVANIAGVGFSAGGYTGSGGVNEPAGTVHKGEVVWSQNDIRRFGGVAAVEALRNGNVAPIKAGAKGSGPGSAGGGATAQSIAPTVNVIEDASKAGTSQSRQVDGRWVIDQFVANIRDNGKAAKEIQQMFGMGRAAR